MSPGPMPPSVADTGVPLKLAVVEAEGVLEVCDGKASAHMSTSDVQSRLIAPTDVNSRPGSPYGDRQEISNRPRPIISPGVCIVGKEGISVFVKT